MNAVDLVKKTCRERGISIAKLERECNFSNGYIGKLKKGTFPVDKARKISEYLGIDLGLLTGVQTDEQPKYYLNEETERFAQWIFENPEGRILFDAAIDSKPKNMMLAAEMLKRFKETNSDG